MKINNKGFTLIELLAVIAVLALVVSITLYLSVDVMKNAKLKSYQVTINNVEKNANTYVTENNTKIFYLTRGNSEYQCVTVGNLIETGYLDTSVIDSPIDLNGNKIGVDDFIYIERDSKSKALLKTIYNPAEEYDCNNATKTEGDITFLVNPNINTWSHEKTITINYKVKNRQAAGNYQYVYSIGNSTNETGASNNPMSINISEVTTIHAKILDGSSVLVYKTLYIEKIDNTGPTISLTNDSLNGNVNDVVKIPITVTDTQSGVDSSTIDKNDFKVTIGGTTISLTSLKLTKLSETTNLVKYELEITDSTHRGDLIVKVPVNTIFDKVENGNAATQLPLTLTMNQAYKVTADANNGTISTTTGWIGSGANVYKTVTYGSQYSTLPTPTRTGYTFEGWWTTKTGGTKITTTTIVSTGSDHTIYAHWIDKTAPTITDIGGGTALKATSQTLNLKCSDAVGVTAYYFGTTDPTTAAAIKTTTAADLTSLTSSSGLSKTVNAEGTYYLACKDAADNFAKKSIVIRKYQVRAVLEKIAGTTGTYTSANYETNGNATAYYIKNGTSLTLENIYTIPTGAAKGTFKGYTTAVPGTGAQTPSTTNPTVANNNTTIYYMWFNRSTYAVTISKTINGKITAQTVTKTGNSADATTSASATLTVKHGDTIKVTASANTGYTFNSWSGGYVSGEANPTTGTAVTAAKTITGSFTDKTAPSITDIGGGTALKATSQTLNLKCSDAVGVTAYYFGTTDPTTAAAIKTTTAADLTSLTSSSGLSKTVNAEGTYYLACKDAADNFAKKSIVIRKYQVRAVLEKIAGTTGTYTSANYETNGNATAYYIKNGTSLTLENIYTIPTGAAKGTFKGYTTAVPGTGAQTPSTTNPTVANNNTTIYYMWFNRSTYAVTISKTINGKITAQTVTKTGNSADATTSASATLTVKHGDTIKVTASANTGYTFNSWSGGYVSGEANPTTGTAVTAAKTITGSFTDKTAPTITDIGGGMAQKATTQTLNLKCTDITGVTAYYFGTTNPTTADAIKTTTAADLTSLTSSSGLNKTVNAEGTYYLACKDAAGNFAKKSIVIRKYQVRAVIEKITGTAGTYTSANYETSGTAKTYYIKENATITLTSVYQIQNSAAISLFIHEIPTGANPGLYKGYTTGAPGASAQAPTNANPTVATNNTTIYYTWFNRITYTFTISKTTNGKVTAETVTQTGNKKEATTSASATMTVKYGDKVKATASGDMGYGLDSWSGGYLSGSSNPATGATVNSDGTISANMKVIHYCPSGHTMKNDATLGYICIRGKIQVTQTITAGVGSYGMNTDCTNACGGDVPYSCNTLDSGDLGCVGSTLDPGSFPSGCLSGCITGGSGQTVTGSTTVYVCPDGYTELSDGKCYTKADIVTLTFNPTGGSVNPTSKQVNYNSTYGNLPTPTRTEPGYKYEFIGWYTAASDGTEVTSSTKANENAVLYAHWNKTAYCNDGETFENDKTYGYICTVRGTYEEVETTCKDCVNPRCTSYYYYRCTKLKVKCPDNYSSLSEDSTRITCYRYANDTN